MKNLYIGLMSGTSMDGIDAVIANFDDKITLIANHTKEIPNDILNEMQELAIGSKNEINRLGELDRSLGALFAQTTNELLLKANIKAESVKAIGSHGQTIRHMPYLEQPFSMQIGDPNTIAVQTNINVIADFRKKDIALGGQGAPLVPAFHKSLFNDFKTNRFIVNIGGIANITFLSQNGDILGFDTGPGNCLMDGWVQSLFKENFDLNGQFAATGIVSKPLLKAFLKHSFLEKDGPKSTGKEEFNLNWLLHILKEIPTKDSNVQATLLEFTACTIAQDIKKLASNADVYICGGGALNPVLMQALKNNLPGFTISSTDKIGVDPKLVEALAFAWLAKCYIEKKPANCPLVTGAKRPAILGALFPAD